MILGLISDLHVDLNDQSLGQDRTLEGLCIAVKAKDLELLLIAGDISNDFRTTRQTLEQLEKDTGVPCLFVPGNHDLWNEHHPDLDAWSTYETLKSCPGNLANGPVTPADGWVLIGDTGWYDYSFGDQAYTHQDFERMCINIPPEGERVWQDSIMAPWGRSNQEMHRFFYHKLERQLQIHSGKKILLLTHMLPHRDFTVQPPGALWGYLNAFLGSQEYGRLISKYNVRYAVFGHVHYHRQARIGSTTFICPCLGYTNQWQYPQDAAAEAARTLVTIEI